MDFPCLPQKRFPRIFGWYRDDGARWACLHARIGWGRSGHPPDGPGAEGNGGHPNLVGTGANFDLFQQANGAGPLLNPIDIILALPNYGSPGSTTAPILPLTGTLYAPYPGGPTSTRFISGTDNAYGLAGGPFQGEMTTGDIYSFLATLNATANANFGQGGIDASNNMTNLTGALSANGISTTGLNGFDIYVFQALTMFPDSGNDLFNVSGATLTRGTFIVGFGEEADGTPYVTPFTEAGFAQTGGNGGTGGQNGVPEPASLVLLGSALFGFGVVARRRRRSEVHR